MCSEGYSQLCRSVELFSRLSSTKMVFADLARPQRRGFFSTSTTSDETVIPRSFPWSSDMAIALPMVSAKKPRQARPPSKKAAERAAATDQAGRHLYFRFNVIRARMQAHGIYWTCWLGLKLLAHCGLEPGWASPTKRPGCATPRST